MSKKSLKKETENRTPIFVMASSQSRSLEQVIKLRPSWPSNRKAESNKIRKSRCRNIFEQVPVLFFSIMSRFGQNRKMNFRFRNLGPTLPIFENNPKKKFQQVFQRKVFDALQRPAKIVVVVVVVVVVVDVAVVVIVVARWWKEKQRLIAFQR